MVYHMGKIHVKYEEPFIINSLQQKSCRYEHDVEISIGIDSIASIAYLQQPIRCKIIEILYI